MIEIGRKQNGEHGAPIALSKWAARSMNHENQYIFWTFNQQDPHLVDLTEFATGKTAENITGGKHNWTTDFRGRPSLIAELIPAIKHLHGFNRSASVSLLQEGLRFWWRVFEEAESSSTEEGHTQAHVHSVADLQILHHHIARRMRVGRRCHNSFTRIANLVRVQMKLPPLYWPSIESEPIPSEVPETWEVERIRHALKRQWFDALSRMKAADKNQADLWGWKHTYFKERGIHVHEVYRAVIELTGHPLPSTKQVRDAIGVSFTPDWMQPISTPIAGLYPTRNDVRAAFLLCLMYSGWNVATLADLNVDDRFVEPHPTDPGYHVVYGFKMRGQSEQYCIGRNKRSDAPGTILRVLVERTRPLRELVRIELVEVDRRIADGVASAQELNELLKQRKKLMERVRSPWLYPDPHGFGVVHITSDNLNYRTSYRTTGTYLSGLIKAINLRQPPEKQIRTNIVPGDLRDSYIGFAYEFSNYSVLTAQIAAGHKSAETTQGYLRHKSWKAHSAMTIHKFQTVMFREIEECKSVDPTILRAHMEWNGIADDERARLAEHRKNRSRIGVACKDPTHPPLTISPTHAGGGCRIQRCTLCPENAILLPDSYDGIAMRVAELEFLRANTPVTVWTNSSFLEELANAESVLELYDPARVEERLVHWRGEIEAGQHKAITWEGAY